MENKESLGASKQHLSHRICEHEVYGKIGQTRCIKSICNT